MKRTRTTILAVLGLAATALAVATTSPAAAEDPTSSSAAAVTTDEQDCHETNIARAVTTASLRPLVPSRYDLLTPNPAVNTTGRITVFTYTCFGVSVDGQPVVGRNKPTTVTIGTAAVRTRDGLPLASNEQQYILWYGTDNPVLFAKLQQTGLPVSFLPHSSATITSDGATSTVEWAIRGAGLDYDETAVGTEPTAAPAASTTIWWHDGPEGDLRITYDNELAVSAAIITADFRSNELLSHIIALPNLLQINGVPFVYIRGSWTSQVSFVQ
jgi:hypothetical protein